MKEEKERKTERLKKRASIHHREILMKNFESHDYPCKNIRKTDLLIFQAPELSGAFQIDCRSFFTAAFFHHHPKTNKP